MVKITNKSTLKTFHKYSHINLQLLKQNYAKKKTAVHLEGYQYYDN